MDSINLTASQNVLAGLHMMMEEAIGINEYVQTHVEVEVALLIIEVAKRSPDHAHWFPRGQWATIQSLEAKVDQQLETLFQEVS